MAVQHQREIRKRDETFATRTVTRLWQEVPSPDNPYLASQCRCHGYDILDLAEKRSFTDVLFLLFQGEFPSPEQSKLLETLLILLINPGPRHPAVRAAMNAGVSRTQTSHLLPIGLSVLTGEHLGSSEVMAAMRFLTDHIQRSPSEVASQYLNESRPDRGDFHPIPGFGSRFGGIDPMPQRMAAQLRTMPGSGAAMAWGASLVNGLLPAGVGWLTPGVAAAVLHDLGFSPWAGAGLFQLACAPGILAHGLELANQPITSMPFLDEKHYVIATSAKKR